MTRSGFKTAQTRRKCEKRASTKKRRVSSKSKLEYATKTDMEGIEVFNRPKHTKKAQTKSRKQDRDLKKYP